MFYFGFPGFTTMFNNVRCFFSLKAERDCTTGFGGPTKMHDFLFSEYTAPESMSGSFII